jgi:hypothetical protein
MNKPLAEESTMYGFRKLVLIERDGKITPITEVEPIATQKFFQAVLW